MQFTYTAFLVIAYSTVLILGQCTKSFGTYQVQDY